MVGESHPVAGGDVVLTGPQRSGTTLVCSLLNRLAGTVALDEPLPSGLFGRADFVDALAAFFAEQRALLASEGRAKSKVVPKGGNHAREEVPRWRGVLGAVPGRLGDRLWARFASREIESNMGWLELDAPAQEPFTLIVKHPAAFTAALPMLVERFPCVALVRNPLATLASWNTVDFKRTGRAPIAERIDPALGPRLDRISDRYDRQISLLSWYFEKYVEHLPRARVLRYEDVVTKPSDLAVIAPAAAALTVELKSRNANTIYSARVVGALSSRLLATDSAIWQFYERSAVERLTEAFTRRH
ncbi:MAG TPA: hypothetical protein VH914_03350 [Acidimicrobiia bacterium]|nr:hypothetical protein [Acidimicrobiia bacterium]